MATEKLFYENVYCKVFQAKVLSCAAGKHGFDVVLDKTAFYPEGGGQPGDTGYLADVRVTDTHEANGEIVHYCEKPLDVGSNVEGRIDWERRLSLMQLHSGEHILSGIVHRRFGYDNVGWLPSPVSASENCVGYIMDMKKEMSNMAYSPTIPPKIATTPHNMMLITA